jgi:hypothetical protein
MENHRTQMAYQVLSVRKVVPTLTSKSAEIYPSMVGAKQLVTLVFILVPGGGGVRLVVVCSGHYITLHRGACKGVLQARWERRLVLQVPEVLIETSTNIGMESERHVRVPARGWRRREVVRGKVTGVATSCPRAFQQRWGVAAVPGVML